MLSWSTADAGTKTVPPTSIAYLWSSGKVAISSRSKGMSFPVRIRNSFRLSPSIGRGASAEYCCFACDSPSTFIDTSFTSDPCSLFCFHVFDPTSSAYCCAFCSLFFALSSRLSIFSTFFKAKRSTTRALSAFERLLFWRAISNSLLACCHSLSNASLAALAAWTWSRASFIAISCTTSVSSVATFLAETPRPLSASSSSSLATSSISGSVSLSRRASPNDTLDSSILRRVATSFLN
mmetsp:Transcript_10572/g.18152  ORF Transcript_10572/g.18152 Transcript_10572/m.18152 type:complete len:237 (-) Transcript_10572:223-933(-)